MKCEACNFESTKSEKFIELSNSVISKVPDTMGMTEKHDVYACPKCGTLRIFIPKNDNDSFFDAFLDLIDDPTNAEKKVVAKEALYDFLDKEDRK